MRVRKEGSQFFRKLVGCLKFQPHAAVQWHFLDPYVTYSLTVKIHKGLDSGSDLQAAGKAGPAPPRTASAPSRPSSSAA